ncbi:hypothetical protein [Natrinema sp. 1APR25-10V2]|uniref:DUF7344 domain-containing protein n=1 Tax=Natrinema sp. 1APR25-10V2 TaxID=2951081 RepID=UPI0028762E27|nr:hypothetical protein [Natrinema sp. 1APR25-10V2]MDS0476861.1 hypothetical protein [Natrinema sp. 1APR25-10V2]
MAEDNNRRDENQDSSHTASDGSRRMDEILTALADTHRRYVLYHLQDVEQASVTDTAEQVAAWKEENPPPAVPDDAVEQCELRLSHHHLPTLEEMSLIEYDDRSKQLVFTDPPELVDLCLDHCADRDLPG